MEKSRNNFKAKENSDFLTRRRIVKKLALGAGLVSILPSYAFSFKTSYPPRKKEKWLIIAAHPDDESKASSLIFTERNLDDELIILIMRLTGESGIYGRKNAEEAIKVRSDEMKKAAEFLKADELKWWLPPHPKNPIITDTNNNVIKMTNILNDIKPTRIMVHWGLGDSHPDHVGTAKVVKKAINKIDVSNNLKSVYYFGEQLRTKHLLDFNPNYFVDISEASILASVIWARHIHKSQSSFTAMNDYLNYYQEYGKKSGYGYADAYVKCNV